MRTLPLALALLLIPSTLLAKSGWSRLTEDEGVTVYSKNVEGSDLVAFKGVAMINAPIEQVFSVLSDNTGRTEWVDRCEKSWVLRYYSKYDCVIYQHFEAPLLVSDRDYVYRATATRDAQGTVRITMNSVEHWKAPKTVGVRGELMRSAYVLVPVGRYRTRVTVEIHMDPKGWIPTSIVNLIQRSWPVKTLSGLKSQLKKGTYKTLPLPPMPKKKPVRPETLTVRASSKKK